jgi:Domain of unknown function (DUF4410)
MNTFIKLLFIPTVVSLVGCASTVNRNTSSIKETSQLKEEVVQVISFKPLKGLAVTLDPSATAKLADNDNFSRDKLYEKINLTLSNANYLQAQNKISNLRMEVVVTNIRVRSGAAAILLGFLAGADYITGQVYVKDGDKVIDNFEVDISYAFGGAMGETDTRMNWMYESFATKILEEMNKLMPMAK